MSCLRACCVSFGTDGYTHLSAVWDAETTQVLATDLDAMSLASHPWIGPWDKGQKGQLLTRSNIHERPLWAQALQAPLLVDALQQILGKPPVIAESLAIVKPPTTGQTFPWHQDSAYYGDPKRRYVLSTVYLDASTADNGPVLFLAGSHTKGLRPHDPSGSKRVLHLSPSPEEVIDVHAQAGDVTLFDYHLVHGSKPNVSDRARRTVRVVYTT
jgi:ectoine hydroxylase-related dioxygenase (phytanoyl-CoA dioxygenase family)